MRKFILLLLLSVSYLYGHSEIHKDTLYTELKNDIVILSSTKETNSLKSLPASVSVFSPKNLSGLQVHSLKDLSSIVPNYYVPDYGSKMTAPLYIRGIGARSGSQTVSYYVDNIPYFNTSSFDTELFDIQRIEVLSGTQGTLYGRNSMGGIINVYTYSPLVYQGTNIEIGGGDYGEFTGKASYYHKIHSNLGVAISGYYKRNDGYFINHFSGKRADAMETAGGRAKLDWRINNRLMASYSVNFDFVNQGAFPYADLTTNEINYNSPSYYKRKLLTNGFSLNYKGNGYEMNSTTGYQYLNDDMNMDQDYTPKSYFTINQKQLDNSISEEFTIKSSTNSNYQWSNGVFGFYDYLSTVPPVYMLQDGIDEFLQAPMDKYHIPIKYTDHQINLNGEYKSPTYGAAIFHQSTFNNLFSQKGLSFTFGLRLDYEKTSLNYNANTVAHFQESHVPGMTFAADTAVIGTVTHDYLELLPKAVIKYELNSDIYFYASASKGYKSGGHNIQIFADILQEALAARMKQMSGQPVTPGESVSSRISYNPEHSWNYEVGGKLNLFKHSLEANFALFYMDVSNIQITQFIKSGGGRKVSNAGKAVSQGFELGLKARPCNGFYLYGNYGFADARFKNYSVDKTDPDTHKPIKIDYKNKHIPFAPTSTYSIGASLTTDTSSRVKWLDNFVCDVNYGGAGRIYWTEDNQISQGFYGTLNARLAFTKKNYTLEFWGKNLLNRDYDTFVFESMGNHFGQKAKPFRCGATLKIKL